MELNRKNIRKQEDVRETVEDLREILYIAKLTTWGAVNFSSAKPFYQAMLRLFDDMDACVQKLRELTGEQEG